MSSPELRELTASEPLTLEEEYEMMKKWQYDDDKLTFIILSNEIPNAHNLLDAGSLPVERIRNECPMIGDVNLFFKTAIADDDDVATSDYQEVEVEIMIAESAYRRSGKALSALHLILSYVTSSSRLIVNNKYFPVKKENLVARVQATNNSSIKLFEKLGFKTVKYVEVFGEVEMRFFGEAGLSWVAGREISWI